MENYLDCSEKYLESYLFIYLFIDLFHFFTLIDLTFFSGPLELKKMFNYFIYLIIYYLFVYLSISLLYFNERFQVP